MLEGLPVDEDVAVSQTCSVYEIVAEREVLGQILVRGVRGHHTQIVFVLAREKI